MQAEKFLFQSLFIEREDFKEEANRKFFRLTLGKEVRLKNAYIIKGEAVVKDAREILLKSFVLMTLK